MNNKETILDLSYESLTSLCDGKIAAIWLKNFYPLLFCQQAVKNILNSNQISYYPESPEFKRIGTPYSVAYENFIKHNVSSAADYFENSQQTMQHIQKLFEPNYSPLERLLQKLEQIWPNQVTRKIVGTKSYLAGIIRILQSDNVSIPPHADRYLAISPELDTQYKTQLTANIYLQVPKYQGNLNLWLEPLKASQLEQKNELAVFTDKVSQSPIVSLQPQQGDVILFNSNLIHSVSNGPQGPRISLGLFIGLNGKNSAIEYWS